VTANESAHHPLAGLLVVVEQLSEHATAQETAQAAADEPLAGLLVLVLVEQAAEHATAHPALQDVVDTVFVQFRDGHDQSPHPVVTVHVRWCETPRHGVIPKCHYSDNPHGPPYLGLGGADPILGLGDAYPRMVATPLRP
jgi:hypothetical protein